MNERFKQFRKESHFSQVELANALGISQAAVSGMERGLQPVTDRTISQIVATFGVSEEWLRTGEGEMYALPDEDEHMVEMFARLSADEIEPWQRKTVSALAEFILNLPADALPAFQKLLTDLGDAPEFNKKDES